ncbi:MarR family winged helix-turn-helix transcriptional regulator [Paracoccus sp. MKU1]|uniref:MarR family winged helix-turn-helix transcriptional regulator n=1 Tax=Paracoccus sp. MKU1 TaxID=1745182 RepID=UPI0007190881|nr:MarR family transcriptional regulator [Paracoccus sp. MKU1]KRW95160.1 MarR family transcriptional regulator [Paracoccus sp. MKU1]
MDEARLTLAEQGYDLDRQIGFVLRKAYQRHSQIFFELIGEDLTATQFSILFRLLEQDAPISQNALGRMVAMDAATTKGVITRLLQRELVSMRKDEVDRRRYLIEITPAGRALVTRLMPRMKRITQETLAPLSADEAGELLRLLSRIT